MDPATFKAQLGGLNNQSQKFKQIAARIDQVKAQVGQRLQMVLIQEQQQGGLSIPTGADAANMCVSY